MSDNPFEYHKPNPEEIIRIEELREVFYRCLGRVQGLTRPGSVSGRYRADALKAMEEACMWATKSVVFERDNTDV